MKKLLKKPYALLPFKKHIFHVINMLFDLPPAFYKHLYFNGAFKVQCFDGSSFSIYHHGNSIENDIFWSGLYGAWEKDSLLLWSKLARNSQVIFDIGANTGIYSLVAKCLNPGACVYAFEPVPKIFSKLEHNAAINNYDLNLENLAVSDFCGGCEIYDTHGAHSYSASLDARFLQGAHVTHAVQVTSIRLDEYIKAKNIDGVDLLKIDVESLEAQVLDGMGDFLKQFRPNILVEVLTDSIAERIEEVVEGIDYSFINLDENGNFEICKRLSASKYHNFLICKPELVGELIG